MAKRPNFLIILADDLGFSDLGCFGGEIKTPVLDKLASEGVRFADFSAAAACSPTRSMLLTGTDNHIAGIGAMAGNEKQVKLRDVPGYEGYLNNRVVSISELLKDDEYFTVMTGKWHLGFEKDKIPVTRGFEKSWTLLPGAHNHYGFEPQLDGNGTLPGNLLRNIPMIYAEDDRHIHIHDLPKDFYSTDFFTDKLIEYLKAKDETEDDRPFFAYLAYSAPHWPLQAHNEDVDKYRGVYNDGPEVLREKRLERQVELGFISPDVVPHEVVTDGNKHYLNNTWDELTDNERIFSSRGMEIYAGMVSNIDRNVGKVIDYLENIGELDNTFVVFMSDNGAEGSVFEARTLMGTKAEMAEYIRKYYDNSLENLGKKNSYIRYGPRWAQASTAPSRLYKMFSSQGGIRVPFLVRHPPLTDSRKGQITHEFSTVMDLAPTILELAGVSHPGKALYKGREVESVLGKSMVKFLKHESLVIHPDDHITGWELHGRSAVRKGKWKAVYIPAPWGPSEWELFDLSVDPGETNDLADQYPEKFKELSEAWETYADETGIHGIPLLYGTLDLNSEPFEGLSKRAT